jgi:hypothetical protein
MARGDTLRRAGWAWALAAAVPAVSQAGEPAVTPVPVDVGFLEFLAEEPVLDEDMGEALMSGDLDREIERAASRNKVKDDGSDTQ